MIAMRGDELCVEVIDGAHQARHGKHDPVMKHLVLYFALYYSSYPACIALSIYPFLRCSLSIAWSMGKIAAYRKISGFLDKTQSPCYVMIVMIMVHSKPIVGLLASTITSCRSQLSTPPPPHPSTPRQPSTTCSTPEPQRPLQRFPHL